MTEKEANQIVVRMGAKADQCDALIREKILRIVPADRFYPYVDALERFLVNVNDLHDLVRVDLVVPAYVLAGLVIAWRATVCRIGSTEDAARLLREEDE